MPDEEVHSRWPSVKILSDAPSDQAKEAWEVVFRHRPEVMHRVIRELIKRAYSAPGKSGQRPMPREEDVDLWGLLYGEHADRPLREVLFELTDLSERQVANKLTMSRTQFRRLLAGEYEPTAFDVKEIADVVGVPPAYFLEFRRSVVTSALMGMFEQNPGIVTDLYVNYLLIKA